MVVRGVRNFRVGESSLSSLPCAIISKHDFCRKLDWAVEAVLVNLRGNGRTEVKAELNVERPRDLPKPYSS